jgi:hypothetical protein
MPISSIRVSNSAREAQIGRGRAPQTHAVRITECIETEWFISVRCQSTPCVAKTFGWLSDAKDWACKIEDDRLARRLRDQPDRPLGGRLTCLRLARRLLGGVLPTGFGIFRGERRDKVNGTMVRKDLEMFSRSKTPIEAGHTVDFPTSESPNYSSIWWHSFARASTSWCSGCLTDPGGKRS